MAAWGTYRRAAPPVAALLVLLAGAGAGGARLLEPHPADPVPEPPAVTPSCLPSSSGGVTGSCPTVSTAAPLPRAVPSTPTTAALPSWVLTVLVVVVVLAVAAGLAALLVRRRRHRAPRVEAMPALTATASAPRPPDPGHETDPAVAMAATPRLGAGAGERRRLVLDAWIALEEALADSGTSRAAQETSGELVRSALSHGDADPGALAELHALYLRARYSPAPVGVSDPAQAAALLDRLQAQLALPAGHR